MNNLKEEIRRITSSHIVSLEVLSEEEGQMVSEGIIDKFVNDNPRALWEGFKYRPISIDTEGDYPYLKLPSLFSKDEELLLVVDDNNVEYHVLKGQIDSIMLFIEDCEGLDEYYLVSEDWNRIICENDHDQLLYLDLKSVDSETMHSKRNDRNFT
jgi:hypothetical protein